MKQKGQKKPELLAPAGEMDALRAAVENGADAVYVGGKAFSARASAANFSDEELAEAVKYAHLRGVKVYVALNTLVDNREMPDALAFAEYLSDLSVDGVIVQDLGLIRELRRNLPDLRLHASTQMTMHNVSGISFLKEWGIQRVVLARETGLKQITQMRAQTCSELEVFVHGALCIAYSGQCLMSSMIGGRSGNRGRCAQPCRLAYELIPSRGVKGVTKINDHRYLLSTRDLNTLEILPDLVQAGVDALKIEGRMKRPEYVATVVRVYRQALDRYWKQPEAFQVDPEEVRELEQIFNREFTPGYFMGNPGRELMSHQRPNNRGVYLGRVHAFDAQAQALQIKLDDVLRVGDGLEIWVTRGGRLGLKVRQLKVGKQIREQAFSGEIVTLPVDTGPRPGDRVFKTYDHRLMEQAMASFKSPQRLIPLQVHVTAVIGSPLILEAIDGEGHSVRVSGEFIGEPARQHPLTREGLRAQLERLGNTAFKLGQVEYDLAPWVMFPLSEINQVRRKMVAALEEERLKSFPGPRRSKTGLSLKRNLAPGSVDQSETFAQVLSGRSPRLTVAVGDWASALAALTAGAEQIYLPGHIFRGRVLEQKPLAALAKAEQSAFVRWMITLPHIMPEAGTEQLYQSLEKWEKIIGRPVDGWLTGNLGGLNLILQHLRHTGSGSKGWVCADYPLNCFNRFSVQALRDISVQQITLSPELNQAQLAAITPLSDRADLEMMIHGNWPLMLSEHCVVGAIQGGRGLHQACTVPCLKQNFSLKDRKGFYFPLEMDEHCRMYLYNARVLDLLDQLETISQMGFGCLRLEVRREAPEYVREIVQIYRTELDRLQEHQARGLRHFKPLATHSEAIARLTPAGLTRGHFYRGIIQDI